MDLKGFFIKNAPKLFIFGGMGLMGAGTVVACVRTKKVKPAIEAHKQRKEELKESEAGKGAYIKEAAHVAWDMTKIYILPLALTGAGAFSICKGADIFSKRQEQLAQSVIGLSTAYSALSSEFDEYRQNVRKCYGDAADQELYSPTEKKVVALKSVDEEGEVHTEETEITLTEKKHFGRYFCIGESPLAYADFNYNMKKALSVQYGARTRLRANGFLFLSEVWEEFALKQTADSFIFGWVYDPTKGDEQLDLGLTERYRYNDVTGEFEKVIYIRPNVNGPILTKLIEKGLVDADGGEE